MASFPPINSSVLPKPRKSETFPHSPAHTSLHTCRFYLSIDKKTDHFENLDPPIEEKMLRVVATSARLSTRVAKQPVRFFSEKLTIPTDKQQQYGRRKEELDAEEAGGVGFNRDPIIPHGEQGTKENPILVSSVFFHSKCFVGIFLFFKLIGEWKIVCRNGH